MPIITEREYGTPDDENPEWTKETFAKAKRFHELPEKLQHSLRGMKGAKFVEEPEAVTLTLKTDLAAALKATGPGWEDRADQVLREKFVNKAA